MSPSLTAEQVAAFYRAPANLPRIRYSMIVFNWYGVALVPFLCLLVMQIRRMKHHTPILAYAFYGCLTGGPVMFVMTDLWLAGVIGLMLAVYVSGLGYKAPEVVPAWNLPLGSPPPAGAR